MKPELLTIARVVISAVLLLDGSVGTARAEFLTATASVTISYVPGNFDISLDPVGLVSGRTRELLLTGSVTPPEGITARVCAYPALTGSAATQICTDYAPLDGNGRFFLQVPPDVVSSEGVHYEVFARDGLGVTASVSGIADVSGYIEQTVGPNGATVRVPTSNPDYGQTFLDIPAGALNQDIVIEIEEIENALFAGASSVGSFNGLLTDRPVAAYRFYPPGLVFRRPATLSMLYRNNDAVAQILTEPDMEERIQLFLQEGSLWRPVGGLVNRNSRTVTTRINHFSVYASFPTIFNALADYRPGEKIISPNGDGFNDELNFGALPEGTVIDILTATGARVRTLHADVATFWDGRDDSGKLVESGVYIYQYKAEGKTVSGVVGVAK